MSKNLNKKTAYIEVQPQDWQQEFKNQVNDIKLKPLHELEAALVNYKYSQENLVESEVDEKQLNSLESLAKKLFQKDDLDKESALLLENVISSRSQIGFFFDIINDKILEKKKVKITKTPLYLTNIVEAHFNRIESQKNSSKVAKILIKLGDGLKMMNGQIEEFFNLPANEDTVKVRSALTSAEGAVNNTNALHFFSKEEEDQKILYQVVKDGLNSVMLTIKLQDFRNLPKLINLKRQNRLIHSYVLKEDFAFFQELSPDIYMIELKNQHGQITKQIELNLVEN